MTEERKLTGRKIYESTKKWMLEKWIQDKWENEQKDEIMHKLKENNKRWNGKMIGYKKTPHHNTCHLKKNWQHCHLKPKISQQNKRTTKIHCPKKLPEHQNKRIYINTL